MNPPEGYREALAAHRTTRTTTRHTNPQVRTAADRQLRSRLREPEKCFADGRQALAELRAKAAAQQAGPAQRRLACAGPATSRR
ncbi:hypothetical protein ACFWEH_36085 [Streptomyces anulatus]|uniref:hypothetical protein n=1 Tax=Streptomyces TaxID=1883 RepID=UPI0011612A04|nr:hypothetical protein [Streptomyces sp. TSRI0395]